MIQPLERTIPGGYVQRFCYLGKHWTMKAFFGRNIAIWDGRATTCCVHDAENSNRRHNAKIAKDRRTK